MSSNLALDQRFNFSNEQLPCISIFASFFLSFIVISLSLIIANQQHFQQSIQRIIVITTGDGHLEFWQGLGIWALSGHLDTTTVSKPSHLLYTTHHATVILLHVDTGKIYILLFTAMVMINSVLSVQRYMSLELHSIGVLRIVSQHQGRAMLSVSEG